MANMDLTQQLRHLRGRKLNHSFVALKKRFLTFQKRIKYKQSRFLNMLEKEGEEEGGAVRRL